MTSRILMLLFLVATCMSAQDDKIKFGKVSKAELEQKIHSLEKEAEAAILYKKERVYYNYNAENGFTTTRYAHLRVKIYNKSGTDRGTIKVPLYISKNGREEIGSIKGYTYNLVNGKVEETKLKKEGIFKENANKYRENVSIAMPEVKEGSVIELEYKINSDFAGNIDDFRFQYGIPVNKVELSVEIPQYYIFKRYTRGAYPIQLTQSRNNRKMEVRYRQENDPGRFNGGNKTSNLEFYENVYKVSAVSIPSLKNENYTDNIDNYRSSIKFELASTQFPNSIYKNYSLSWEDVAKAIYKYDDFGEELKKSKDLKEVVEAIKNETQDQGKLAQAIFDHVKNRMTWNEYYGVGSESGLEKAYEQKTGNVADINLMLTVMLRYAGFKSNPVLVSTKSHGIPLFPTNDGFNYVIAAIEDGDKTLLLDATEKKAPMGMLHTRALNWTGRLIREDGTSKRVSLLPEKTSKKIAFMNVDIAEDGSVKGKLRSQLTGNYGFDFRDSHKDDSNEDLMNEMEERYLELEVDNLETTNLNTYEKPFVESCTFKRTGQTELIGGKIYFKPALFMAVNENPFKANKRDFPIDFVYSRSNKVTINYVLPEGYKVETLPESKAFALPDDMGSFKYDIKNVGNKLQFSSTISMNTAVIPAIHYQSLKEFYNQVVTKHSERVVLSKI